MNRRHQLAVFFGISEDAALAAQMDEEPLRGWRLGAFAGGVLVCVLIPAFVVMAVLDQPLGVTETIRAAAAVCAFYVVCSSAVGLARWRPNDQS